MNTSTKAFSKQAAHFDEYNAINCITQYCRKEIYKIAEQHLAPNSSILELNCGTGIDAIYFSKNHRVLATDGATGMIEALNKKISDNEITDIQSMQISFDQLDKLGKQKFDFIFSNVGGLNCTENLADVIKKLPALLKENGKIMLVIMPPICFWEHLHVLSFNFKLAFRRWKKAGARASVEGVEFKTFYYSPERICRIVKKELKVVYLQGLCNVMPPEYMYNHLKNHPFAFNLLAKADRFVNRFFPFNKTGDYFVIVLEK